MKILITGASSGLGYEFVKQYIKHDLILVARRIKILQEIKERFPNANIEVLEADLSKTEDLNKIVQKYPNIDMLINNAGLGLCGTINKNKYEREKMMIDVNINAVHYLSYFYLQTFYKKNSGAILNVASVAAFQAGPLMSTYYGSKSFVLNFTIALAIEAKKDKKNIYIGCLCPGPTETEFNDIAEVEFSKFLRANTCEKVVSICLKMIEKKKIIIVPTFSLKSFVLLNRFVSKIFVAKIVYNFQKSKIK